VGVPESLRATIEQQMSDLPPEAQRVLEAGSVAGMEFTTEAVAAGIEMGTGEIEEHCEALMRHQILRPAGVAAWPDGTGAGRYAFGHALYQRVIYQQLREARRIRLHLRIGTQMEKAYSSRAGGIAAELAEHFVRGRETRRAVQYLQQAAETAARRYAHREVIVTATRALELMETLPDSLERTELELSVQLALGTSLMATRNYAVPETGHAYSRALALCQQMDAPRQRFTAVRGLWQFHLLRAQLRPARALGEELLRQAQQVNDPSLLLEAHRALGSTLYWCGEIAAARAHFAQGIAQYDPQRHHAHAFLYGLDPGVTCLTYMALALWGLGYPDQAYQRGQESLTLARELAHPVKH
jgi:predicted ATPase